MRSQVLLIVSLFIFASIILVTLGFIQSEVLNSVRAFVRGEGLWAKSQKDAVYYLERYAHGQKESDFEQFKQALSINLGDKQARLLLQNKPVDKERARQGFLAGNNHPEDIDSLITFFLRFQDFYYMKKALSVWQAGDEKIEVLIQMGHVIRSHVKEQNKEGLKLALKDLDTLNHELNVIATEFSLVLSEGARWIKSTILTFSVIIISLLALGIFIITRHIINALNQTETELMLSEKRFLSLYDANVIGIMDWDMQGHILDANDAFLNMLGYSRDELIAGRVNWQQLTPPEFNELDDNAINELKNHAVCRPYEKEFIHKKGHRVSIYIGAALLTGETDKGICFVIDQSLQKLNETQLKLSATVFNASSDSIIITDQNKHVVAVNNAYCKKTGRSEEQLIGYMPPIFTTQLMTDDFYSQLSASLNETDHWQGDALEHTVTGNTIPMHMSIDTVRDKHYSITHYVISMTDITERKEAEDQLKKLAHYDYLTGLANRSLYHDRLTQALVRAKRHKNRCALLFLDLDKFKPINDQYGHEVGDLILQIVASRLKNLVRTNDTIARLGGDEFVIIMEELKQPEHAAELAKKVIASVSKPCQVKDLTLEIGCSIGISIYPLDGQDTLSLTRNADIAMYAAKGSGRNSFYFFHPSH
ncbi:MAG: sensor domain-containing diguanylate cyclase [Gammaproteobacteria bacterium]|nr:sensor domain-containing diguanylate cyclase [Gammaproteobacteria bacterium]